MSKLSGISVGSVDFIGDRINEVNGAGTVMTEVNGGRIFADARPAIMNYLLALTRSL
jgi:glutathione synthase/RimK-type ligase-like ATP-grasp enzyme